MDTEDGSSSPNNDQTKQKTSQGDGRSSQPYRRPNQNYTGNSNMFDPMMAMNMGLMNPMQFQLMMQQTGMSRQGQQQPQQQQRSSNLPSESQPPPSGYVCYKCGQAGHWIYYCPNVPKGQYVPRHNNALPSSIQQQPQQPSPITEVDTIPEELVCTVCKELLRKPSISLCCGKSFCEECITNVLNTNQPCPQCGKDASSIQIVPNKTLGKIVDAFVEERGTSKPQQQEPLEVTNTDWVDNDADKDDTQDDHKSSNRPLHQKQPGQNHQSFDSNDNSRPGHGRNHNMTDTMGSDFNNVPSPMPPTGLPFMPNPTMFMGGGNGAVPPFGFPDMSWMFGANGSGGGFPPVNGIPPMPPLFFGSNNGAPIHYPGGFSNNNRQRTTGARTTNTQQQPQQQQQQQQPQPQQHQQQQKQPTSDRRQNDSEPSDSSSYRYDGDKKDGDESAKSSSRHRSPSRSHHRDSRKRSRSRSRSPSHRRRHSSTSHRKSRRTSRSPPPKHHAMEDKEDDVLDYGEKEPEEDEDDRHHRRYRSSRHRSRSSRRHHGSSSSRYRSSSRRRNHSNDRHRKSDRHRDSSRDRSHRYDKK